ncbi:MAG: helix-turn-helix domain-containing protein [Oscillospiraceae bacterium]|nr:helix-turn-helix domain-containing protein [Oscillospiraceae bacterium]
MEINEILKALRQQKHLTQQELAATLEINLSSYQKYERPNNTITPSIESIVKIADFYGVSTDYILGRTTIKQMATEQPDPFANIDVSELEKRIIKKYTEFDEDARMLTMELFRQISAIFNDEQQIAKKTEIQQSTNQKEDDKYIIQTTTVGKEMDRLEAERVRKIADAKAKKNAV